MAKGYLIACYYSAKPIGGKFEVLKRTERYVSQHFYERYKNLVFSKKTKNQGLDFIQFTQV